MLGQHKYEWFIHPSEISDINRNLTPDEPQTCGAFLPLHTWSYPVLAKRHDSSHFWEGIFKRDRLHSCWHQFHKAEIKAEHAAELWHLLSLPQKQLADTADTFLSGPQVGRSKLCASGDRKPAPVFLSRKMACVFSQALPLMFVLFLRRPSTAYFENGRPNARISDRSRLISPIHYQSLVCSEKGIQFNFSHPSAIDPDKTETKPVHQGSFLRAWFKILETKNSLNLESSYFECFFNRVTNSLTLSIFL